MLTKKHSSKFYEQETSFVELTQLVTSGEYDINSNKDGYNALHLCMRYPSQECKLRIGLLLNHGINVNSVDRRAFNNTPLHLFIANEKVDDTIYIIDEAKRLKINIDFNVPDVEGKTPLIYAAKIRNEAMALHILANAGENLSLDAQDNEGMTAAHYACALGLPKLLEELIRKRANVNLDDKKKRKPIECTNIADDEITAILKSASIDPDRDENALHNVIVDENFGPLVSLDVITGARMHNFLSIKKNQADVEKVLELSIADTTKLAAFMHKRTPMDKPALLDLIKHSLNKQQKQNILKQFTAMSGISALQAVKKNQPIVRDILIKNGVNYDRLIRLYAANNKTEQLPSLLTLPDIAKHIDQPGLPSGKTALHHAAAKGLIEICTQLVNAQASLDCQDNEGNTPLLLACQANKEDVVILLVQRGADVAKKNNHGLNIFQMMKNANQNGLYNKVLQELIKRNESLPVEATEACIYKRN